MLTCCRKSMQIGETGETSESCESRETGESTIFPKSNVHGMVRKLYLSRGSAGPPD